MFAASYGFLVQLSFLTTFVYAIGFVGNVPLLPKIIDSGTAGPLIEALPVNTALPGVFAVQHAVMARRSFKRRWTRFVPEPVERSSFVLAASLALALRLWQWRPIATPAIREVADPEGRLALYGVFRAGWAVVFISTFPIGIWFEERDLVAQFVERYRLCREQTGMLIRRLGKGGGCDQAKK
jgi:protein-S-isoprenylcysteine O-methyltransferase Ste14